MIKVSSLQAIKLEVELNKSNNSISWIKLGDKLYEWRLHPRFHKTDVGLEYKITKEQMEWVSKNITKDLDVNKFYKLILEE